MLAKVRSHLTYANVVSSICLFLVLGGAGAYAANTVFSTDIVDGEVKTPDLADAAVTRNKLASSSVTNCNAGQTEVKYRAAVNNLVVWRDNGGGDAEVFKPTVGNFIPDAVNGNADTHGEMLTFMSNTGHIVWVAALRNTAPNPDLCHYRAIAMQR